MTLQWLTVILYPVRFGRAIFWTLFFALVIVPLFDLTHLGTDQPTTNDQLFFFFAAHQMLYWVLTGSALILSQLWCERRFAQLEQ